MFISFDNNEYLDMHVYVSFDDPKNYSSAIPVVENIFQIAFNNDLVEEVSDQKLNTYIHKRPQDILNLILDDYYLNNKESEIVEFYFDDGAIINLGIDKDIFVILLGCDY